METKEHKIFQPFEKVLVKDCNGIWQIDLYSRWCDDTSQHVTLAYGDGVRIYDNEILEFEGNEDLLGTSDNQEEEIDLMEGEWIMVADIAAVAPCGWALRRFAGISEAKHTFKAKASDEYTYKWNYAIRFSNFNPEDMKETKRNILYVENGKIVRYKE